MTRPTVVAPEDFARTAAIVIYNAMVDAFSASAARIRRLGVRQLESFTLCLGGGPIMAAVVRPGASCLRHHGAPARRGGRDRRPRPGSSALRDRESRAVAVETPRGPNPRITITPSVISDARHVIVLARGSETSLHVFNALRGNTSIDQTPARLVRDATWVLDEPAAMLLGDV